MIEDYLPKVINHLSGVEKISSSYIPAIAFSVIEEELLMDKIYKKQIPEGFGKDLAEQKGLRRIKNPANANYRDFKLRVGTTTLHIRPDDSDRNLESVVMIDIGDMNSKNIGGATAQFFESIGIVMLHDNGAVSACYSISTSPYMLVNSWYPFALESLAGFPYPKSGADVALLMMEGLKKFSVPQSNKLSHITDIVMLATDVYKSLPKN